MADASGSAGGLLGTLYIRLTAQTEDLDKKMDASEKSVKKHSEGMEKAVEGVKTVLEALGLAWGVHELLEFVEGVIKGTDELKKFSVELGISIDKVAGLKFAADKANIGDEFARGMREFSRQLREAQVEGSAAETLFKNILEVDPKQTVDKAFDQIISKFSEWQDGVNKTGVAQELFGIRNARFINLLSQGSEGIKKEVQEMADVVGMSYEEAAKKSEEYEEATVTLKYAAQGLAMAFLEEALPSMTDFKKLIADFLPQLRDVAKVLGESVPYALGITVGGFKYLLEGIKVVGTGILGLVEGLMKLSRFLAEQLVQAFEFWANAGIKAVNFLIDGINSMSERLPDWIKRQLGISGPSYVPKLELFSLGKPNGLDEWINIVSDARKDLQTQLSLDFKKTAEVVKEGNKEVKDALESGPGGLKSKTQAPNVPQLKDLNTKLQDIVGDKQFATLHSSLRTQIGQISGIEGDSFGSYRYQEETKMVDMQLKEIQKIRDSHIKLTETQEARLTEIEKLYSQKRNAIALQETHLRLTTASDMFGNLADISKAWAGEQSGIYKTMFAMSKAFAIADATVKIAQGIAAAAANPWPLNLFAMASVIAATASIVSSIQAVQLEFGGGKAAGGPVSSDKAYLIGEKGPEMFVPSGAGTIVPNNKLGGNVQINVNNYGADVSVDKTETDNETIYDVTVRRVKKEFAADIQSGNGPVPRALQSAYRLRRGQA